MLAISTASALCAQGIGFLIVMISRDSKNACLALSFGIYLLHIMLTNFFAPTDDLMDCIKGFQYLSYTENVFEMSMIILYGFDR